MSWNYLAFIQGGVGPDVWDREAQISAVDFQDASTQARGQAERLGGIVVSLEINTHRCTTQCEKLKAQALELQQQLDSKIGGVLSIRCSKHFATPQQNKAEHSGGECGGCIAEDRDFFKTEMLAYKAVIDSALDKLQSLTGLRNAGLDGHICHITRFVGELKLIEMRDDGQVVWEHLRGVLDELYAHGQNYKEAPDIFFQQAKLIEERNILLKVAKTVLRILSELKDHTRHGSLCWAHKELADAIDKVEKV